MKHNWEYKKLGDICSIVGRIGFRGYTREDLVEKGNGAISLSPSNIIDGKLNFDDKVSYLSWEKYFESPEIMLAEGDVVFTKTASIGKCALVKHLPVETTLNPQLVVLKNIQCDSSYLTYMLQDKRFQEAVLSKKGGTSIPTISQAFLGSLPVPVPPIETQKQIVAELDKINETIEDCRELLRNLDALAQSLFYDFFGDPNINPKDWEMRKFVDLCETFTDGDWIESKDQSSDGFRLIQTGNIGEGIYLDKSERSKFISADTFYSLKCKEVFEGDILISRLPDPIGRACILPKLPLRSITAVDCTIVRPKSCILPKFLLQYTLTDAYYNSLSSITKGATRKRVSRGNLGKVLIPVPPLELQEKFAERIEQIEAQKKAVESTIAELQTLLDSRMDYWFN